MLHPPAEAGPLLLVSVNSALEARAALRGGADILDIKEPRFGSLGKADDGVIAEIAAAAGSLDPEIPISAALGELVDWKNSVPVPRLPAELAFVKLGLSGWARDDDWPSAWKNFRGRLAQNNPLSPHWVAVIYADREQAQAPSPERILEAAVEFSCAAVLVDTFHKDGRSLVEVLSPKELQRIADEVHGAKLPLAVAGGLRRSDLPCLKPLAPEIVAIRTAACREGDRTGEICEDAVRQFRETLKDHRRFFLSH